MAQNLKDVKTQRFKKACCTNFHDSKNESSVLYDIDQRRHVSSEEKTYILEKNVVPEHRKRGDRKIHICDECLQVVKNQIQNPSKKAKTSLQSGQSEACMTQVTKGGNSAGIIAAKTSLGVSGNYNT